MVNESSPRCVAERFNSFRQRSLFVMCPHSNDFHDPLFFKDLIDESMLNIYAARICSGEITHELLVGRRSLKRVEFKNF